jgi:hypothetical protein
VLHPGLEPDQRKSLLRTHRPLGDLRHQGDVLSGREARDQIVELEHEAHVAPAIGRKTGVAEAGQLQVAEEQAAARGMIEPTHDVQERGLAAAGRAKKNDELAGPYLQVNALKGQNLHLAGDIALGQSLRGKDGVVHGQRALLASTR